MQKVMNRTLGGKIVSTSSSITNYNNCNEEIYQVTFMRADNRKMTISVDKDIYDKCINSNQKVIFDIDVVMEKEGDINHYDKKLTKARKVLFLGIDIDADTYAKKMEEDLVWLSRYAKPLPAEKSKGKKALLYIESYFVSIILFVAIFGTGIGSILAIPLTINHLKAQADKYANYEVTNGKVIEQSDRNLDEDLYEIKYTIEYWVNDEKYVIRDSLTQSTNSIWSEQHILYDKSDPNNGLLCEYNNVAKAYLPGLQGNSEYLFFVVMAIMGVLFLFIGVKMYFFKKR
ncbi:MAG: hypothetical protein K2M46_10875 [Lachnospiraceae bacterium]|nr:hypothetical protein [Lachnospiraceae bacterium]